MDIIVALQDGEDEHTLGLWTLLWHYRMGRVDIPQVYGPVIVALQDGEDGHTLGLWISHCGTIGWGGQPYPRFMDQSLWHYRMGRMDIPQVYGHHCVTIGWGGLTPPGFGEFIGALQEGEDEHPLGLQTSLWHYRMGRLNIPQVYGHHCCTLGWGGWTYPRFMDKSLWHYRMGRMNILQVYGHHCGTIGWGGWTYPRFMDQSLWHYRMGRLNIPQVYGPVIVALQDGEDEHTLGLWTSHCGTIVWGGQTYPRFMDIIVALQDGDDGHTLGFDLENKWAIVRCQNPMLLPLPTFVMKFTVRITMVNVTLNFHGVRNVPVRMPMVVLVSQ